MSEYVRPGSLSEAVSLRREHPDYLLLAGGTDLLIGSRDRPAPPGIIDLFGLEDLVGVREESDGTIEIGAATTYRELLSSDVVSEELPLLRAAAREVGALQIQARGTLGGNIGTSSPVGDTLPVLLALDAEIVLAGAGGERRLPYDGFVTGYRETVLGADEIISAIRFPPRPSGLRQYWRKMGTRQAQSISKVMLACAATLEEGIVCHLRIALGAVADRPIRARLAEACGTGNAPSQELSKAVADALAGELSPIDDLRSTSTYRRNVARNVVYRFMESLGEDSP